MISILVPVYNVEKFIERCLKSISTQTYSGKIECILIDDCGHDSSISIAENFIKDYEGKCFLGIDAGSTTTKFALISKDGKLLHSFYDNNNGINNSHK